MSATSRGLTKLFVAGSAILFVGLACSLRTARLDLIEAQQAARERGIVAENFAAALAEQVEMNGQLRLRAKQAELERDANAQLLRERPVVRTTVYVDPEPAEVETAEVVEAPEEVTMVFEDDWMAAEVAYRPAEARATLVYDLKPMRFTVGARCGEVDPATGVRPATITIDQHQAPLTITIEQADIDPEVCNAIPVVIEDGGFDVQSAVIGGLVVLGTLLIGG